MVGPAAKADRRWESDQRIVIVGAGIGGLALANAMKIAGRKNVMLLDSRPDDSWPSEHFVILHPLAHEWLTTLLGRMVRVRDIPPMRISALAEMLRENVSEYPVRHGWHFDKLDDSGSPSLISTRGAVEPFDIAFMSTGRNVKVVRSVLGPEVAEVHDAGYMFVQGDTPRALLPGWVRKNVGRVAPPFSFTSFVDEERDCVSWTATIKTVSGAHRQVFGHDDLNRFVPEQRMDTRTRSWLVRNAIRNANGTLPEVMFEGAQHLSAIAVGHGRPLRRPHITIGSSQLVFAGESLAPTSPIPAGQGANAVLQSASFVVARDNTGKYRLTDLDAWARYSAAEAAGIQAHSRNHEAVLGFGQVGWGFTVPPNFDLAAEKSFG